MAYTTINKSSDFFNTKLYPGNGSTQTITGVGFQPDLTYIKARTTTESPWIMDVVQGVTKANFTSGSTAEQSVSNGITAWNSDGFALGANTAWNQNSQNFASWNWKAGTAVSGNTSGSGSYKTYTGSVNTTSGFSIIKYTGNGTAGHTIPHRLGAVPKMIIVKRLNSADSWRTYHGSLGATKALDLNNTGAANTVGSSRWNDTEPTSSVFTVGTGSGVNANNSTYIAYCFAEKQGYSQFGSYTGNNSANGTFVYTGFLPAFVMIKCSSHAVNWGIYDNKRVGYNEVKNVLFPNLNDAENTDLAPIDLLSNGFKMRRNDTANDQNNKGGATYIYMAFGQSIVGTNNIPNNAF